MDSEFPRTFDVIPYRAKNTKKNRPPRDVLLDYFVTRLSFKKLNVDEVNTQGGSVFH